MSPTPGRYKVDPARTTISFTTKHMFGLRGTFTLREGTVWVGETPPASRVEAIIDAGRFNTNTPRREKDVHSPRFLDVARHTDIVFRSEAISEAGTASWRVVGR